MSPSCARRWRMRASRESKSFRGFHRRRPERRPSRSGRTPRSRASSLPTSPSSPRARCARWASWSPCAWRPRAPKPKTSPTRVELDLEELPAVVDMLEARTRPPALRTRRVGRQYFFGVLCRR
jgi:hypothetical protein